LKTLAILGATGSIGCSTLEIVDAYPDKVRIASLTGGKNLARLAAQIKKYSPSLVAVMTSEDVDRLRQLLGSTTIEIQVGVAGLIACVTLDQVDVVVSAIVGAAGLVPTMAAIEAGKDIALANKETLVAGGPLVMQAARRQQINIYPVDSEHSAIYQSLQGHRKQDVRRLILTASGGPFREFSLAALTKVTPQQALAHPNWAMGPKITIDSATMMNKGLEVIEARWLFDLPAEKIAVHIHPQSIVHSMVEYEDGSVIAQMGVPDMKAPIAYALSYPERLPLPLPPLDLCRIGQLTFTEPDVSRFACLELAYAALRAGGTVPAVLNAANEIAVQAFLDGKIAFLGIADVIRRTVARHTPQPLEDIATVINADQWGRDEATREVALTLEETA
jgi:1-deoxy-D-xylulose-5-phosphate reductoisomerase